MVHGPAALALALAAVLLAACSSTPTADPQEVLDAARARLEAAETVHVEVAGDDLPSDLPVLESASGDARRPAAFSGTFRLRTGTITADVEVLSVDGALFARLPFADRMAAVDPADIGVNDPALLLDRDRGIVPLIDTATEVTAVGAERDDGEVVQVVEARIPGAAIADLLLVADEAASFTARLRVVEGTDEVREVSLTGPFYEPGVESTYTVRLTGYDEPVEIPSAPEG